MYGTQTNAKTPQITRQFENDVKMYGTQTNALRKHLGLGLRMM